METVDGLLNLLKGGDLDGLRELFENSRNVMAPPELAEYIEKLQSMEFTARALMQGKSRNGEDLRAAFRDLDEFRNRIYDKQRAGEPESTNLVRGLWERIAKQREAE